MPKAKPDQVIVHRFELQTKEREALEMVAASTTIRNIGQGVGSALLPFSHVISALAAAYIAKEGVEKIIGWWNNQVAKENDAIMEEYIASGSTEDYDEYAERKKVVLFWYLPKRWRKGIFSI